MPEPTDSPPRGFHGGRVSSFSRSRQAPELLYLRPRPAPPQHCYHPPLHLKPLLGDGVRRHAQGLVLAGLVALLGLAAPAARADDFVTKTNQLYADIAPANRSDVVLLPVLAKMDPPPKSASSIQQSGLL